MLKYLFIWIQLLSPTHLLTRLVGWFAEARTPWFKNFLIKKFIKLYKIDLENANVTSPSDYSTFNEFFIRQLKPELRPITNEGITSPVDGTITQIGIAQKNLLLQAKSFYFDIESLLGGNHQLTQTFSNSSFATFYLAPNDYHRFHMPISGRLIETLYVPGRLFSVNKITSELLPNLYSRNERLICIFDTEAGKLAVILVGALIVGSIQTQWMNQPIREKKITSQRYDNGIYLSQGAELGFFKMGSSVILLFEQKKIVWSKSLRANSKILFGQSIGNKVS